MTTFYICRHGQTENNRKGLLSGWIDTPLTEEGYANTAGAAAKLAGIKFDAVFSSDLGRAFMTAYLIAWKIGYAGRILWHAGLREINYGELANHPISVYPPLSAIENATFAPKGGESLAQMQDRVLATLKELAEIHPGQTLLLVAHDGTINAVRAFFEDKNIGVVDAESSNPYHTVVSFTYENDGVGAFREISI